MPSYAQKIFVGVSIATIAHDCIMWFTILQSHTHSHDTSYIAITE